MSLGSMIATALKGKVVATALVGVALVGGGTAAMAATPGGQNIVKTITASVSSVTPSSHSSHSQDNNGIKVSATARATDHSNVCPGLADAQNIAKAFSLSTDSKSATIKTICSLHDGSYKGLNHALGYGEIENLLTYAQSLAKKANATLTDGNIDAYLAAALKNCGSSPIAVCVKANMPATQHGNSSDNNTTGTTNSTNAGNSGSAGKSGGVSAKPTATPTPRH